MNANTSAGDMNAFVATEKPYAQTLLCPLQTSVCRTSGKDAEIRFADGARISRWIIEATTWMLNL